MTSGRASTAERLSEAALELFEQNSYADTDIDQIADRAATSRRTFFRHFDSKDDAILRNHRAQLTSFRANLPSTPSSEPTAALVAVIAAAERVMANVWAEPVAARRRYAVIFSTDALVERMAATDLAYLATIREQLEPSLGATRAAMVAAAGMAVANAALEQLAGGAPVSECAELLTAGFADLRAMVDAWLEPTEEQLVVLISSRASLREIRSALDPLLETPRRR